MSHATTHPGIVLASVVVVDDIWDVAMNQWDHRRPTQDGTNVTDWAAILAVILVAPLTACAGLLYLLQAVEVGPAVGDIVAFDTRTDPMNLAQLRISAIYAPATDRPAAGAERSCVLSPSVMVVSGGSLVIEAKEIAQPTSYRVHWAGPRTDQGAEDCGTSADLTVPLRELRVLANAAGGFGVGHKHGMF